MKKYINKNHYTLTKATLFLFVKRFYFHLFIANIYPHFLFCFKVYGKLALKFENFFKRWLQIFYPREISTSLEEKNRQLMKLMHGDQQEENNENNVTNNHEHNGLANGEHDTNAEEQNGNGLPANNENRLLFDFSNSNDMMFNGSGGMLRKAKKKSNPDKDKYIAEPQYVTKRTSSGRLVKMKISTDFDYTSDQEQDGKRRRSERQNIIILY